MVWRIITTKHWKPRLSPPSFNQHFGGAIYGKLLAQIFLKVSFQTIIFNSGHTNHFSYCFPILQSAWKERWLLRPDNKLTDAERKVHKQNKSLYMRRVQRQLPVQAKSRAIQSRREKDKSSSLEMFPQLGDRSWPTPLYGSREKKRYLKHLILIFIRPFGNEKALREKIFLIISWINVYLIEKVTYQSV